MLTPDLYIIYFIVGEVLFSICLFFDDGEVKKVIHEQFPEPHLRLYVLFIICWLMPFIVVTALVRKSFR